MSLPSFGPLFQLHWMGVLCPCLQKDEDSNARQALTYVNTAGKRILWIRIGSSGGSGGMFSLGGFFRKDGAGDSSSAASGPTLARLSLRDNASGTPALLIDPTAAISLGGASPSSDDGTAASATSSTASRNKQSSSSPPSFKLDIKLFRVDKVTLDGDNDIVLYAKRAPDASSAKELLRFRVLNPHDDCPVNPDERNMLLHHMAVLVEWERQRRASQPDQYDDDDEEEEENQPNFLQARAQKAAHFAKRELELQQTRRDREKRKAKLVAESGGLKYTALALARQGS